MASISDQKESNNPVELSAYAISVTSEAIAAYEVNVAHEFVMNYLKDL